MATITAIFATRLPYRVQAAPHQQLVILYAPIIAGIVVAAAFSGFVLFLVIRQRPVARILIAIWLAVISLYLIYFGVTGQLVAAPRALLGYGLHAMLAICLWLLFRPDANKWFAGRWTGPEVIKVFE